MKDICLIIDYRRSTIHWREWKDDDEEGITISIFGRPLYSIYKTTNDFFGIYINLLIEVNDTSELTSLITKIKAIPGIDDVFRVRN